MQKDDLGNRMKRYEEVSKMKLTPQICALMRYDGKSFHTLTRQFDKPYDSRFQESMLEAALYLCENIQGSRVAYIQSDEITLLITQRTVFDQGWFDLQVQKMCSVGASMCTLVFNRALQERVPNYKDLPPAVFDARVFSVPVHDVNNNFLWRQNDAVRNSIQSYGRVHFSHKQLLNKNCNQIQEMLFSEKGINWNDMPTMNKRGACIVKSVDSSWKVDLEIPIFSQDRDYIERNIRMLEIDNAVPSSSPE